MGNAQSILPYMPIVMRELEDPLSNVAGHLKGIETETFCMLHGATAQHANRFLDLQAFSDLLSNAVQLDKSAVSALFARFSFDVGSSKLQPQQSDTSRRKTSSGEETAVSYRHAQKERTEGNSTEEGSDRRLDVLQFLSGILFFARLQELSAYQILFQMWRNTFNGPLQFLSFHDLISSSVRGKSTAFPTRVAQGTEAEYLKCFVYYFRPA
uniref:Uncharacterized protein n=1 Tax=Chromera velia CCMP2878 TaxID=1169474 RepID=A0A0G4FLR1_9ALVE|eukprot:Cvel_17670.t1-p1 / transcript=Cvel_17670.t1 / gene=Cvel_17670 / organism=Chromera_velia_CCMP2878 / gene_product=hypothetical protein / transcript_product=hypothetical protein / location=Cvel_scaffold1424:25738-26367(-) / protein_length=210 / sequence_SO=supercontig / SO=protein_coding / is_pseudo=false